jgi:ABC-2 type transport system ATP-binding protein
MAEEPQPDAGAPPTDPQDGAGDAVPTLIDDDALLRCTDLRRSFGDRVAVDGVSFSIAAGEAYGLLGPNGAGKTTTISMLCGLLEPDAGEVVVAGHRMGGDDGAGKAAIGYVPQEIALYPELTARENLRFFGRLHGLRKAELGERVDAALEVAGLADRARDRVEEYSGGMKRRLNIAAGLLHRPRLLVLDEPTVGVDPQSRNAILETVADLSRDGLAVLYTSHYMEEVDRLCDRVGIIDEGRIIAEGTRHELVTMVGEADRVTLTVDGPAERLAEVCRSVEGVTEASAAAGAVELVTTEGPRRLPAILEAADGAGLTVTSVNLVEPDLEAVFLHLTGKALRDE